LKLDKSDSDLVAFIKKLAEISQAKPSASSRRKRDGNMGNVVPDTRNELGSAH